MSRKRMMIMKIIMVGMTDKRIMLIRVQMKIINIIMESTAALLPKHHQPGDPRSAAHLRSPNIHTSPSRIVWDEEGERW